MTPTYRIRDWGKHFENNRTRDLKELRFVILPNKHDGDGYTELLDHPNGAAHYGAWVAMVQVASKCDPRGTLLRDGARPHDPASLSRLTRLPTAIFEQAIPRLLQIGWIEADTSTTVSEVPAVHIDSAIPQEGAVLRTAESRTPLQKSALEENGIEGNGIEEKERQMAHAEKPRSPRQPKLCDDEWLDSLQSRDIYAFLDVRAIHSKMVVWCENKGKVPTRGRLLNWLNSEDKPIGYVRPVDPARGVNHDGTPRPTLPPPPVSADELARLGIKQ